MSFDSLPYETQFKYLANLPLQDTINYCKTGSTAYIICQTDSFWKYKTHKTFGIDVDVIDYEKTVVKKYKKLEDLYSNNPGLLIIYLIDAEQLSQIQLLFERVPDDEKVNILADMLSILVEKGSAKLMEEIFVMFEKVLQDAVNSNTIRDIIRTEYFEAVLNNKMDLVDILNRYYDPNIDNSKYVYEWLHHWDWEADPAAIASLIAAGVSFDRLDG